VIPRMLDPTMTGPAASGACGEWWRCLGIGKMCVAPENDRVEMASK
jgi:hypothetical protein